MDIQFKAQWGSKPQSQQSHLLPCHTCMAGHAILGLGARSLLHITCQCRGSPKSSSVSFNPSADNQLIISWGWGMNKNLKLAAVTSPGPAGVLTEPQLTGNPAIGLPQPKPWLPVSWAVLKLCAIQLGGPQGFKGHCAWSPWD